MVAQANSQSQSPGQGPDGGMLLSDDAIPPSQMFDANGEFQWFVPNWPREPQPGLVVGFIDSGTTSAHPQLAGLVLEERTFVDGPVHDEIGHGTWSMLVTFMAGPQSRFGFYSAKVTRDGSDLRAANVLAALQWLVAKDVRVVNMSLGFDRLTPDVQRLCDEIAKSNVLVVAAAGNLGPDVKFYPAHCGLKNVLSVGEISGGKPTPTSGRGHVYAEPPKFLSRWAFLNDQGLAEIRAGHREASIALYKQSIGVKENPTAYLQLALTYSQTEDYKSARSMIGQAYALAPNDPEVNRTLGFLQYRMDGADKALPRLERAVELDPKNQRGLLNLASAFVATKDFKRAMELLDQAQANDATDPMIGEVRAEPAVGSSVMAIKDWFEAFTFLNAYPPWLRAIAFSMPPIYILGIVLLYVFAPSPALAVDALRRVAINKKNFVAFDVTIRNPTTAVASITAAKLELYSGAKPHGGLASVTEVSATYSIEANEQGALVRSDQDELPFEVAVIRPYAGNPYESITVPLSQQVDPGRTDRFILVLKSAGILLPARDTAEIALRYNGDQSTVLSVVKLN